MQKSRALVFRRDPDAVTDHQLLVLPGIRWTSWSSASFILARGTPRITIPASAPSLVPRARPLWGRTTLLLEEPRAQPWHPSLPAS